MRRFVVIAILMILIFPSLAILNETKSTPSFQTPKDPASRASTIIVDINGSGDYTSIQDAIDNANAGDTIRVWSGIYYEQVYVAKTLSIIGNGSANTTINGTDKSLVMEIYADWCNVSGLSFTQEWDWMVTTGLYIGSSYDRITNCSFYKNYVGIYMDGTTNSKIDNCNIEKNGEGLNLYRSMNNKITNSFIQSNIVTGVFLLLSENNTIMNCICNINGNINDQDAGIYLYESNNNVVISNSISSNLRFGLRISYHSKNNIIKTNQIENNTNVGISIISDSNINFIHSNNFINNNNSGIQAIDNGTGNRWNQSGKGNYWSDWTTPDQQPDGIVDYSYNIAGTSVARDYYPLTDPFGAIELYVPNNLAAIEDELYLQHCFVSNNLSDVDWTFSTNADWLDPIINQVLTGTPTNDDVGNYWVNVKADDGKYSKEKNISLQVKNVNDDPSIITNNSINATEDEPYFVDYYAIDIDPTNDQLVWNCTTNASFLNFNEDSGILSGIPLQKDIGIYSVQINVTDGKGGSNGTAFNLTVFNKNDPPSINFSLPSELSQGESYIGYFNATDIDPTTDILSLNVTTNASFLDFNNTIGIISGIPDGTQIGTFWINLSATDDKGGLTFDNSTFTVHDINDPPIIITDNIEIFLEDIEYTIDYNATDLDEIDMDLIWAFSSNASFLEFDLETGDLSGKPTNGDVGTYWVNITIDDGHAGVDFSNFTLVVQNVNDPPEINNSDNRTGVVGEFYLCEYYAFDIDPTEDELIWDLQTNASFLTFDDSVSSLWGEPGFLDGGEYWVNITVSDGNGGIDFSNFTLKIYHPNNPPTLEYVWDIEINEDEFTEIQLTGYDNIDHDGVYFSIDILEIIPRLKDSSEFSFNNFTGLIQINASNEMVGEYNISIICKDTRGAEVSQSFKLTILNVNDAPYGSIEMPYINTVFELDSVIRFEGAGNDDDIIWGDELNFTWISNISGIIGYGINITSSLPSGHHNITLKISDGELFVEYHTTIKIDQITEPETQEEKEDDEGKTFIYFVIVIIALVVIILGGVLIFALTRKREEVEKEVEEPETLIGEEEPEEQNVEVETDILDEIEVVTPEKLYLPPADESVTEGETIESQEVIDQPDEEIIENNNELLSEDIDP